MKRTLKKMSCFVLISAMVASMAACGDEEEKNTKYKVEKQIYEATYPTQEVKSDIFVEKIEGLSDDFIKGVDISSILSQEASGVKYYGLDGKEQDIFKILADAGVNYVRVRVWNDPYDANGNGYGGGNCDTKAAAAIGKRAAQYGMKLLVDYHYSDFWADPSKQMVPKAWAEMEPEEKADACYSFTKESLTTILEAGADVGMVQVGNETNSGMSGETVWVEISKIMKKAITAIDECSEEYGMDIQTMVHFTNPENLGNIQKYSERLNKNGVDYDIFGFSYYPYWHGTVEQLKKAMKYINDKYDKKVMVVETSYAYTNADGDGTANSIDDGDIPADSTASIQEQVTVIRNIMAAVNDMGDCGLGVFYWEPAWIPVSVYDFTKEDAKEVYDHNLSLWEKYGSGWASSYAADYDPDDAGVYYGGSSWDNQAWFDFTGHALPSINTYLYAKYGSTTTVRVEFVENPYLSINVNSDIEMPATVFVHYNDTSKNSDVAVTWDMAAVDAIDTTVEGEYTIKGTLEDKTEVTCDIKVSLMNWLANPSFEEEDTSMWKIIYDGSNPSDFQLKEADANSGSMSLHYWSTSDVYFQCEQTLTDLADGNYNFNLFTQGGDVPEGAEMYIYAKSGDKEYKQDFVVDGYGVWQNPEIKGINVTGGTVTVGIYVKCGAKAWGTADDFYLYKVD